MKKKRKRPADVGSSPRPKVRKASTGENAEPLRANAVPGKLALINGKVETELRNGARGSKPQTDHVKRAKEQPGLGLGAYDSDDD